MWNQSVVNEKVYTVSLLFFTIVSWLMIEWIEDPDGPRADRILILVAFLLGLGYSNHPAGFLPLPAIGVTILMVRWKTLLRWKLVLAAFGALVLGLTPFIYEPVRAAYFPAINEGAPTACNDTLEASCTFTKLTKDRLMANINREQYGEKLERGAPYSAQVGMWWLYFKWQWLRDSHQTMQGLQFVVAFAYLALGLLGGYVHWRRDRTTFWYLGPLMFTMTLALIYYLNFKYGWSQDPELRDVAARGARPRLLLHLELLRLGRVGRDRPRLPLGAARPRDRWRGNGGGSTCRPENGRPSRVGRRVADSCSRRPSC